MKIAILSMDIEDWYHLDYFSKNGCDKSYTMLDGINEYCNLLSQHDIKSSFFTLGELSEQLKSTLRELHKAGHEVGSHGWDHKKPMKMSLPQFSNDIIKSKKNLQEIIGSKVSGYRAPCFSMDRPRLDIVKASGFEYDSSRITFSDHPLYGQIDLDGFETVYENIFRCHDFFEFQVSTQNFLNKNIPVSGGGYVRIFPWLIMKRLISKYLDNSELYVFYIHPFEFSTKAAPSVPGSSIANKLRFTQGLSTVPNKFNSLINLLKVKGFKFSTFTSLREELINAKKL
jgi:polysaccharide deacetylase family protein (PEP-CTERM system associated)